MEVSQFADIGLITAATVTATQTLKVVKPLLPFNISSKMIAILVSLGAAVYVSYSQGLLDGSLEQDAASLVGLTVGIVFLSANIYNNLIRR